MSKLVKVNNNNDRTTPLMSSCCLFCSLWTTLICHTADFIKEITHTKELGGTADMSFWKKILQQIFSINCNKGEFTPVSLFILVNYEPIKTE